MAEEIWYQGKGVQISKKDTYPPWKVNTNYTVVIEAPAGAIIAITSEGYGDSRSLFLMKNVYDMLEYGDYSVFELDLTDNDWEDGDSISFDLEPFYGNPDIYVNPETMPKTKEEYKWSSTEMSGMESLTITNADWNIKTATSKKLFVLIYGDMTSSYRLVAYRADVDVRFLVYDCTESGYVTGNEIVQYQLYTWGLTKSNLTLTAVGLSGNVYLYVKMCSGEYASGCMISEKEITEKNSTDLMFRASESSGSIHKLVFEYDPELCR
jgi:hypothetical protein